MIYYEFSVPGLPQGKAVIRKGKYGFYTDPKSKLYMQKIRDIAKRSGIALIDGQVKLTIIAHFIPPKSLDKKLAAQLINQPYLSRPDCDNISKGVCDAIAYRKSDNWGAFLNDSQIFSCTIEKYYGVQEGIIVQLEGIHLADKSDTPNIPAPTSASIAQGDDAVKVTK